METIIAALGQYESDQNSLRTHKSMLEARMEGRITNRAPLGYLNSRDEKDNPIVVLDKSRARLVAKAFRMFSTGKYSETDVLVHVNKCGLTTRKGKPVPNQTFRRMLVNERYSGWIPLPDGQESVRAQFTGIVDRDTFDKVRVS